MRGDAKWERNKVRDYCEGDSSWAEVEVTEPLYFKGKYLPEGESGAFLEELGTIKIGGC